MGFSIKKITSTLAYEPSWAIQEPTGQKLDALRKILKQEYSFLSTGCQSYAFLSKDGKYVVKFFQMKHQIPQFFDFLDKERVDRDRKKLVASLHSYRLAYEEMAEDAGLIYVHLNPSNHLKTFLHIKDFLRRRHRVDLDQMKFVVQRKAELIFSFLEKLLSQEKKESVKEAIELMLQLANRQIIKCLADEDQGVKHNYGYITDEENRLRAVHFDVGRLHKSPHTDPNHVNRINLRIQRWLEKKHSIG